MKISVFVHLTLVPPWPRHKISVLCDSSRHAATASNQQVKSQSGWLILYSSYIGPYTWAKRVALTLGKRRVYQSVVAFPTIRPYECAIIGTFSVLFWLLSNTSSRTNNVAVKCGKLVNPVSYKINSNSPSLSSSDPPFSNVQFVVTSTLCYWICNKLFDIFLSTNSHTSLE